MTTIRQDILYSVRLLAKKPVFTALAALSLALGIGLNTAIFTLINSMLWGPLPFGDENRIAVIWSVPPQHRDQIDSISIPDYMAFKERNRCFESLGAMTNNAHDFGAGENGAPAQRIIGEDFSPELLTALSVKPLMGRLFTPEEDRVDHAAPVILLSYRLWQSRFGGDPHIIGRTILVDNVGTNIIGILRPDFRFSDDHADFVTPLPINHIQLKGSARFLLVGGRLKPGVSIAQAQAEMEPIATRFATEYPRDMENGKPWTVRI